MLNTKGIVKGSVPSEFAEPICEECIYTSPAIKRLNKNAVCKLNKEKHICLAS